MRNALLVWLIAFSCMFAAPVKKCEELAAVPFGNDVRIESAKWVAATSNLPEYCDVRGVIWPEARFAVKLPANWNNRFQMVGNGGWAGTINLMAMDKAVHEGYASASTNTGHDQQKEPELSFGRPGPDNPYAARKVIDYGYMAVHETSILAKKVIRAFYGNDAGHSYWVGCSTGGRQGLMEAQRYPEDFDGYVVGDPVSFLTGLMLKGVWNQLAVATGPGQIRAEKLPMLAKAVYEKCDPVDGLKDGLIENPAKCKFDAAKDLPRCLGDSDGPGCFTAAQIEGLKKVYDGPRDSKGRQLFPGQPPSAEAIYPIQPGREPQSGWQAIIKGGAGAGFMKFAFDPPAESDWDFHNFNFDTDPMRLSKMALRLDATITDMSAVREHGGKILHYTGWADPMVPASMSINYYEATRKNMGEKETDDFYRLFLVPGMGHCTGGPGCSNVDWLTPVVNWVEKGIAPAMLVGAHVEGGRTTRTRPICPYPSTPQYKGSGSIDEAHNFICAPSGR